MRSWKDRYYESKFGVEQGSSAEYRQRVCAAYAQGLCWVLHYYYKGVASWHWCVSRARAARVVCVFCVCVCVWGGGDHDAACVEQALPISLCAVPV
jgi:hypothetical protein